MDTVEWITLLVALPGGLGGLVWLLGGRKRVAGWCGTLWRGMVRAWLLCWVPFVVRVKTTMLVHRHERVFRKGQRQSVRHRRWDEARGLFESGGKALRRYILDHRSVLKTTSRETYAWTWVAEGPYAGLWDPDPWGDPFITNDDAFLDHVAKIRGYDIVDSWHLAALHWWLRCRQKISTKWEGTRRRRRIVRAPSEARRIRVIHWFAWPIALPALTWILWQLIDKGLAP